ncbi:MAG: histone deacetylase [Solirubrobacterales bacterium]|nr:histone deacetylase [Solirubrobacterales bacterium]MBV9365669.1 histone deacetylase [Solirubrobacterales bacterium]
MVAIDRECSARDWLGFERVMSPEIDRAVLTTVHPESYVASIEQVCASGGGYLDLDTVVSRDSFEAALHAAGGAVRLVDLLLDRATPYAFSAHRPPGHHASGTRAMGFCLFNSVALAARYALDARGLERVLILDWDVHHGNGTNDIFHDTDRVLFVSIHQSPLYPGTGPARDVGSRQGRGFTVNLPVRPGADDRVFCSLVELVAVPLARAFAPQLVLISAGYDAHREDPLGQCEVTEEGYAAMTRSMRRVCRTLEAPLGCVLEGGYSLGGLARSVAATLAALQEPLPVAEPVACDDGAPRLVGEARERLSEWWPELAV